MSNADASLIVSRVGELLLVEINEPRKRNAITQPVREGINNVFRDMRWEEDVKAIVITGRGDHFSAGGDLTDMNMGRLWRGRAKMQRAHEMARLVASSQKPVVFAVKGVAFGAGLSLALLGDAIVAGESASLCPVFSNAGLIPDMGVLYTLPARVGVWRARQLTTSATVLRAADALAIGLVDQVVGDDLVLETAFRKARELAARAPLSFAFLKDIYGQGRCKSFDEALALELDLQSQLLVSEDSREAIAAFTGKRKPSFVGG
jgi:enoyl-CoA hydratase/carnithine racemase